MTLYLLDTNIVSDLVRNPAGRIERRIRQVGSANVAVNVVIAGELRFGAAKRRSLKLEKQTETVLSGFSILSLDPPVDRIYGQLRASLEMSGTLIGANDLFIATHALALDCTLVSDNEDEFSRVPGLKLENWLR